MKRQSLDGGDGWIDLDSATSYDERVWWNGSNHVSEATQDKFEHERLWLSRKGVYVIHHWSQWEGRPDSWRRVTAAEAAAWLVTCGHDDAAEHDQAIAEAIREAEV